jgi:hypothetical protein
MKYNKYCFLVLLVCYTATSCKKSFLNVEDNSVILTQQYVTDLKTTGDYLNGIYVLFNQAVGGLTLVYPEVISDNIKPRSVTYVAQYNWSQVADNNSASMNNIWLDGYKIARSCNYVLEKTKEYREQDPTKADDILAQAYAIRAYMYFILVNIFAQPYNYTNDASHTGIPYVTSSDWTQPLSDRQTVAEVYEGLVNDLTNATDLFKTNTTSTLIFNQNATKALLARVYLFKGNYQLAKKTSREVSTVVPIMTGANYPSKLFTLQETEALLQVPPSSTTAGGTYNANLQGRYFGGTTAQIMFLATSDIAGLLTFDTKDVRKVWITKTTLGNTITKYPVGVVAGFNPTSNSYYQTILRSSEMYLTAAESYAKLNMEDSARYFLNAIRARANPTVLPITAAGSILLDSIYSERKKELAFEGLRMFDLLRWKKEVNRGDAISPTVQKLPYPSNKAIAPIPASDVNILGLTQNIGYN